MGQEIEAVDAVRHRKSYRDDNLYIVVVEEEREVFISSVRQDQDPLTGAALDAFSRIVTMAWKCNHVEDVIAQLRRASRKSTDLPGIIAGILDKEVE